MRTTLTIDDNLMKDMKETAHRKGLPLKQLINRLLRIGLQGIDKQRPRKRYTCPTFAMGAPSAGVNLDKALAVSSALEDEEAARELELRK